MDFQDGVSRLPQVWSLSLPSLVLVAGKYCWWPKFRKVLIGWRPASLAIAVPIIAATIQAVDNPGHHLSSHCLQEIHWPHAVGNKLCSRLLLLEVWTKVWTHNFRMRYVSTYVVGTIFFWVSKLCKAYYTYLDIVADLNWGWWSCAIFEASGYCY